MYEHGEYCYDKSLEDRIKWHAERVAREEAAYNLVDKLRVYSVLGLSTDELEGRLDRIREKIGKVEAKICCIRNPEVQELVTSYETVSKKASNIQALLKITERAKFARTYVEKLQSDLASVLEEVESVKFSLEKKVGELVQYFTG